MAEHEMPVSALFMEIASWMNDIGVGDLRQYPGLWRGETPEWTVEMNGHDEPVDGLPFAHARLTHKKYMQFAVLSPYSGAILGGSENDAIEHFRAIRAALAEQKP